MLRAEKTLGSLFKLSYSEWGTVINTWHPSLINSHLCSHNSSTWVKTQEYPKVTMLKMCMSICVTREQAQLAQWSGDFSNTTKLLWIGEPQSKHRQLGKSTLTWKCISCRTRFNRSPLKLRMFPQMITTPTFWPNHLVHPSMLRYVQELDLVDHSRRSVENSRMISQGQASCAKKRNVNVNWWVGDVDWETP